MSNELVLVVDDEPDVLRLCDRILSGEGYNVYTADSAPQAIRIARETPFDVVLLALQMPDSDGITTFETIKNYQPDIIGVVITGYPSLEAAIDALKQGISGFVLKPFTPNELRQAVSDGLDRRRLERDYARLQALIPLYELSRSLMTTVDIDVLLDRVVEMALQETGADRASLMLEKDGKLYIEAARGLPEDVMETTVTPVGEGIAGWVAQQGEPLLLDKSVSMPPELADTLTREEIASAVCAPLALKDRVIGVLNLSKLETIEPPFTSSDRDLITVLAGQVAIAIENARLFRHQRSLTRKLSQTNANLRALQQAATAITSRLSPERVLQTILDGCAAVVNDASIVLGLLDANAGSIEIHLHHGEKQTRETAVLQLQPQVAQILDSRDRAKKVLEDRLSALLADVAEPASIGVIPLSVQNQLLGAMAVGAQQELTEADVMTLSPFADQAAVAIANTQLFSRLHRAYEELHEVDQFKSEYINLIVRQSQTPLSEIKAYSTHLRQSAPENLQPALNKLHEAVTELEAFIDSIAEHASLTPENVNLNEETQTTHPQYQQVGSTGPEGVFDAVE